MECNDQKVRGYGINIVYSIFIDFYNLTKMSGLEIDSYEWDIAPLI